MFEIERLQAYMRKVAQLQYQTISVPPFSLFLHPNEAFKFFNYAIPDYVIGNKPGSALAEPLTQLRKIFRQNDRLPRFEFIDEFDPYLASILTGNGFIEESRLQLMVCSPNSFRPVEQPAGLKISRLTSASRTEDIRDYLLTQQRGFEPEKLEVPSAEQVELKRPSLDSNRNYLAHLNGQPASAGLYTFPSDKLTEVAGIATLEAFRRQGLGSYLTSVLVREAFNEGVTLAFLTAADARAGRVYERLGFQPFATMLAFSDPEEN